MKREEFQNINLGVSSDKLFKFAAPLYWMLTLTNMLQQCAADTDRCTGADEKSPPEKKKKNQTKKTAFYLRRVLFALSHSLNDAEIV